jgi:hypothetical protein
MAGLPVYFTGSSKFRPTARKNLERPKLPGGHFRCERINVNAGGNLESGNGIDAGQ